MPTRAQVIAIVRTLLKTFLAAALGQLIMFGTGVLDMSAGDWKGVAAAGLAAVAVVAYNALDPNYPSYGRGAVD